MFCSSRGRLVRMSPSMLVIVMTPLGRMWVGDWLRMEVEMGRGPFWLNLGMENLVTKACSW